MKSFTLRPEKVSWVTLFHTTHSHYTGKYRGAAHNICNLRYKTPKEIPVVFHNGSTYAYHFIIKELAKEFDGQFKCLGGNIEKDITFLVPIKKELDNSTSVKYKIKFINSFRFISRKLSGLITNLSEINIEECRGCKEIKANECMILQDLKIINYTAIATNVKKKKDG